MWGGSLYEEQWEGRRGGRRGVWLGREGGSSDGRIKRDKKEYIESTLECALHFLSFLCCVVCDARVEEGRWTQSQGEDEYDTAIPDPPPLLLTIIMYTAYATTFSIISFISFEGKIVLYSL